MCETTKDAAARPKPARSGGHRLWSDAFALVLMMVVIAVIAVPLLRLWGDITGDYAFHSVFTERMRQKNAPVVPHFVYHVALASVQSIVELFTRDSRTYPVGEMPQFMADIQNNFSLLNEVRAHYALASIITCAIFIELLGVVVWVAIRRSLMKTRWGQGWTGRIAAPILTVGILVAAPVALLVGRDQRMYLGYIGLNVCHSPTMLALKPLAVLLFFYAAALFMDRATMEEPPSRPRRMSSVLFILGGALVTTLSTLAKPNYTLCLLPAVALFVPWAWYKRMTIRWVPLMLGLVLPAVAVLAWQYYFTYQTDGIRKNSIMFAPLLAMSILSPKYLLWKFFLSILFPGLVWLLFLRGVWADRRMVLAWLVFDCGAAWAYLAAESVGPGDGNFTWGVQMALLVLFIESVLFVLRSRLPGTQPLQPATGPLPLTGWRGWWPVAACAAGFLLHVGYGIGYNIRVMSMLTSGKPGWW